jgi:hypothetical protein
MTDLMLTNVRDVNRYWSQVVTSLVWGQWQLIDAGLRATSRILEAAAQAPVDTAAQVGFAPQATAGPVPADEAGNLARLAEKRMAQGLAPPREIYDAQYRKRLDWSRFPDWARPSDPDAYEGCAHEG